ncbi:MAG: hypothetical protein RLZZ248_19 [Bacteroidota bacterium]
MKRKTLFICCLILVTGFLSGQVIPNAQLAGRFSPDHLKRMVFSTSVTPHWFKNGQGFWYSYQTSSGTHHYVVNPVAGTKKLLFDNDQLAAEISSLTLDPFDGQHLSIERLEWMEGEKQLRFEVTSKLVKEEEEEIKQEEGKKGGAPKMKPKKWQFLYDVASKKIQLDTIYERPKDDLDWASVSPDTSYVLYSKEHNLYKMDWENYQKALIDEKDSTIVEIQLTEDGEEYFSYSANGTGRGKTNADEPKERERVWVTWSPRGDAFTLERTDYRTVDDLWVINSVANPRPTLETYKYHMPGESNAPKGHIHLFTAKGEEKTDWVLEAFKDQTLSVLSSPSKPSSRDDKRRFRTWLDSSGEFVYLYRTSRDLKRIDLVRVAVATGIEEVVIEERLNTYVETRNPYLLKTGEIVHWSERDGWAHFYLYNQEGKLIRQITKGPWHCENIVHLDETNRVLYFEANGKEEGEDPYYQHLYRVNLDGTGLQLLNKGNYSHDVNVNDDGKYFVSNYSRVNTVPRSSLLDSRGRVIMQLEEADLANLFAAGYQFPEPYQVKAGDGITDLYGVIYKPFDFDSTKHYPVLAYVYPGPQTEAVNKTFSARMDRLDRLAQIGFIVVTIGNRGGHPSRSKWYHNYGYGNLRDYGLEDKKVAIEQLAVRHSFIDIEKVGIFGHSGGGFMSTAAMLVYPDFFKVAVSSAGNHENNIYNRWWSEKHHGVEEITDKDGNITFKYSIEKNSELAKNLKGKLLICTGDIDNNVHPANTIRLANALIKANKRFDFFLLPGQRHGFGNMTEYFFWLQGNYFAEHLLGRPLFEGTDIIPLQKENARSR